MKAQTVKRLRDLYSSGWFNGKSTGGMEFPERTFFDSLSSEMTVLRDAIGGRHYDARYPSNRWHWSWVYEERPADDYFSCGEVIGIMRCRARDAALFATMERMENETTPSEAQTLYLSTLKDALNAESNRWRENRERLEQLNRKDKQLQSQIGGVNGFVAPSEEFFRNAEARFQNSVRQPGLDEAARKRDASE